MNKIFFKEYNKHKAIEYFMENSDTKEPLRSIIKDRLLRFQKCLVALNSNHDAPQDLRYSVNSTNVSICTCIEFFVKSCNTNSIFGYDLWANTNDGQNNKILNEFGLVLRYGIIEDSLDLIRPFMNSIISYYYIISGSTRKLDLKKGFSNISLEKIADFSDWMAFPIYDNESTIIFCDNENCLLKENT